MEQVSYKDFFVVVIYKRRWIYFKIKAMIMKSKRSLLASICSFSRRKNKKTLPALQQRPFFPTFWSHVSRKNEEKLVVKTCDSWDVDDEEIKLSSTWFELLQIALIIHLVTSQRYFISCCYITKRVDPLFFLVWQTLVVLLSSSWGAKTTLIFTVYNQHNHPCFIVI